MSAMRYVAKQGKNLRIGFSATVSQDDATWMYDEGIS